MGGGRAAAGLRFTGERVDAEPAERGRRRGVQDPAELEAWRKQKEGLRLGARVGAHSSGRRAWAPRRGVHSPPEEDHPGPVSLSPLVLGIPVQGPHGLGPLWTVHFEAAAEESQGEGWGR